MIPCDEEEDTDTVHELVPVIRLLLSHPEVPPGVSYDWITECTKKVSAPVGLLCVLIGWF